MKPLKDQTSETLEQIAEKRASAMGAVTEDGQRQIVGLLYDQMLDDFQLLDAVKASAESIAVPAHTEEAQEKWKTLALHPLCTLLLATITCVLTLSGSAHFLCAISAMLTLLQASMRFTFEKQQHQQTVLQTKTTLFLDDLLFDRILQKRLSSLDKACMDVARLHQSTLESEGDVHLVSQLYHELCTMDKMQDLDQAQYCLHLAQKLLEQQGLTTVDYSPETAHLYTLTKSDMVDMTLCPAICYALDQSMVLKGSHYIKEEKKGA